MRRLIREYGPESSILFDLYCGTGTTLLEAMLAGSDSVGTDLNPLARLIATVKTAPIDLDDLDREIEEFIVFEIEANYSQNPPVSVPSIPNIDYWFDAKSIPDGVLSPDLVDIVVTSPSYVDSKTAVAYGRFFRLSPHWLSYPNANRTDNLLMGGETRHSCQPFDFETLDDLEGDKPRARRSLHKNIRAMRLPELPPNSDNGLGHSANQVLFLQNGEGRLASITRLSGEAV